MSLQSRAHRYRHSNTYREQRLRTQPSTTNSSRPTQLHENGDVGSSNPPKEENLPHLVQEIEDKLTRGAVECMICYEKVPRSASIWSCSSCYSIFHLNCAKKWARAPSSVDFSTENKINWRCPGCQTVQLTSSKEIRYVCFCGKRPDPPCDFYLTPHSCGEPCGKPLNTKKKEDVCPHLCVLQCHPGPCPPCKAFAPPRLCPCGKQTITTRCSDRLTCGHRCNKLLQCGRHRCHQICHAGPCDPCRLPINASCFCSKKMEVVLCGDMDVRGEFEFEAQDGGVFSCGSTCAKKLACGNHACTEICHPGSCAECDLSTTRVKTCCCGKTRLDEQLQHQRQSCLDPIPTCSQVCGKSLPCGIHHCKEACHEGDCSPCLVLVSQRCRCGSTSRTVECCETTTTSTSEDERFTCEKPCGQKKSCGRHRCSERCCPLSINPDAHLCSIPCGKKLRCGQHACESSCHRGYCPPCVETIFTDLTCACGKTSIPPPLLCGTPLPSCQLPCSIPQPCQHPPSHNCHFGDCPPCTVLVAKECVGGHVVVRNMPCGSKDIRCNELCGKTRQCGLHACGRPCHPPPCDHDHLAAEGVGASCGQTCGAPRKDCRHTCPASCHPSSPCPDIRCQFPVTITCSCGRITANVPCGAGALDAFHEASTIQKLLLQPLDENDKKVPLGKRKLMCNDECAKLERKRVLADAFEITSLKLDSLQFSENSESLIGNLLRRDSKWVLSIEERCKFLVLGKSRGITTKGLKAHIFCPMLKDKRDAVRLIAERWKLSVSTGGWEAKSFIVVHVTQKSRPPARVLGVKGTQLAPTFDHLVDMDPRLVVSFPDLPRGADISSLVLRFGGECELVWLNDKNALAVFNDPSRAATAMRRLDHGAVFQGAVVFAPISVGKSLVANNSWGGSEGTMKGGAIKGHPWKNVVVQETGWNEDEDLVTNIQPSMWKKLEAPISASLNPWSVLDQVSSSTSSVKAEVHRREHNKSSAVTHDGGSSGSAAWRKL